MRVALVTSIEHGGPVEHVRLLARELVAAGATVRAVAGTSAVAEAYADVGADAVLVPTRSVRSPLATAAVRRSLRGFDVVHSHDRRSGLWTLGPPRLHPRMALVHTLHGLDDAYLPIPDHSRPSAGLRHHLAYRTIEARLVGRADAVAVPSEATRRLARRLGYRMDRAEILPNGVDVAIQPARRGTGIGMLTSLEPVKGVEVFLQAARLLHDHRPAARFVIFGTGSLQADLEAQVGRLGLTRVVTFAGRVQTATALAELRLLVVTSHYETSPLVVLEAMSARVPVVATRVGGTPELAPEDTMLLVPPNDAQAAAEAVRQTLDDDRATRARVERARAHVERERSAAAAMQAVDALYRRVLDQVAR